MKKGDIYYKAWVSLETMRGESSSIQIEEWHVTNENKNGFHLKEKCSLTWVKKSKKNFDYGWADSIADYHRMQIKPSETAKNKKLFRTKEAAYRAVIPELKKKLSDCKRLLKKAEKIGAKAKEI